MIPPNTQATLAHQNAELDGFETLIREQLSASRSSDNDHQSLLEGKLAMLSAMRAGLAAGIPISTQAIQASMADVVSLSVTDSKKDRHTAIASVIAETLEAERRLNIEAEAFHNYEAQSYITILSLAEAKGIDLSLIHI